MKTNFIKIILIILSLFILIELVPHFIPNYNKLLLYKYHKYTNTHFYLAQICWLSYLLFFIILIYLIIITKKIYYKPFLVILCILFIYLPLIPILNIFNIILLLFIRNPSFIKDIEYEFPQSINIENGYNQIRKEYEYYEKNNNIDCMNKINPFIRRIEDIKSGNNCWRSLYLKRHGKLVENMKPYFPNTMRLLNDNQIHNAFFSILDPNVEISEHIGYFKGYLRYHLGVIIPEHNNEKAYIICGNEKYIWSNGKGVIFDDMYLHYVKNPTNMKRVVLYLDIKRRNLNIILKNIADFSNTLIENSYIFDIFIKNQHKQDKI
jgi:beta-hydroxylase